MERKRVKGYLVAAALLLLWAAADFYHCFYSGGNLIAYYLDLSNVRPLLGNKLFRGIVKTALGLVIFAVGWFRGKEKPRPRSLTAATAWTALAVLGCWLASMACATLAVAEKLAWRYAEETSNFAMTMNYYLDEGLMAADETPGRLNYGMWQAMDQGNRMENASSSYSLLNENGGWPEMLRRADAPIQTAAAIFDSQGNLLETGGDFLYFDYMTEDHWDQDLETQVDGYARVFLPEDGWTEEGTALLEGSSIIFDMEAMRFTGVLEGTELIPWRIEYVSRDDFYEALYNTTPTEQVTAEDGTIISSHYEYVISQVIREQAVPWRLVYQGEAPPQGELVTLYADRVSMALQPEQTPLRYRGETYPGLQALLEELGSEAAHELSAWRSHSSYRWWDMFVMDILYCHDYGEAGPDGWDYQTQGEPPLAFYLVTVCRSSPVLSAVQELRNAYLWTLLLALVLIWTVRLHLRDRLIRPLAEVNEALADGWGRLPGAVVGRPRWAEAYDLQENFDKVQDDLRIKRNEITRLNTALTYAKEAETERRQMTSHMAHELKTPLAVIHCCCEGLREDIAPEKRRQYLDTILSEAEELDAMVLEMLDLSRLEAGKVKLSRDDFDLAEMARAVFQRLEAAAADRELTVELSCGAPCPVSADEGRLRQAMGNLAANAVRYAPAGSTVRARVWREGNWTCFAVENDSPPFTREELEKIWERFYRREEDRSGRGTGLGLAITRQIVELHGGRCRAENIPGGVRFQLSVPN